MPPQTPINPLSNPHQSLSIAGQSFTHNWPNYRSNWQRQHPMHGSCPMLRRGGIGALGEQGGDSTGVGVSEGVPLGPAQSESKLLLD